MDDEVGFLGMGSGGSSRNPILRALLPKHHLNSNSRNHLGLRYPPTRAVDLLDAWPRLPSGVCGGEKPRRWTLTVFWQCSPIVYPFSCGPAPLQNSQVYSSLNDSRGTLILENLRRAKNHMISIELGRLYAIELDISNLSIPR